MLIGPTSAQAATSRGGVTIHRRLVQVLKLVVDLHVRVSDADLATAHFSDTDYLCRLGACLGDMSTAVWDDFVALLIRRSTGQDPGRVTRTPVLYTFPEDLVLYRALLDTDLCQALRNMMSKFCRGFIGFWFLISFLAGNYSSFLALSCAYFEPSQQVNNVRLMVFFGQQLSLYVGVPFKTPNILPTRLSESAANGSL